MCKRVKHNCFSMSQQKLGHIPLPSMADLGGDGQGAGPVAMETVFSCRVISQSETDAVSNIRTHDQQHTLTKTGIVGAQLNTEYSVTQCKAVLLPV